MKAIVHTKFGPPEVLQLKEVDKPTPADNEVLIKVFASVVTAEDPDMRKSPGLNGFIKPRNPIPGQELAGIIEAVGKAVELYEVGDKVYGEPGMRLGAIAEYTCMPEAGALAVMPASLTFEQAAAIPNGALTALPFLRDTGKIQAGDEVLVYGASGAVGTAAVQIAKYFGAEVTGVCSTANLELVKSLGAKKVIDYTKVDFTKGDQTYDIIFDTVGKTSFSKCKGSLRQNGTYLTTVPTLPFLLQMLWTKVVGSKKAKITLAGLKPASEKVKYLASINEIVEAGKLKAVIDKTYPMAQIAEAHRYVALGHKKGNVVITVASP